MPKCLRDSAQHVGLKRPDGKAPFAININNAAVPSETAVFVEPP